MTDFEIYRRAQRSLKDGTSSYSKAPERFVRGVYPTHVKRGRGAWIFDHADKKYLDFMNPNILGYAHSQINMDLMESLNSGVLHSLPTHHEIEAAEKVKELFPFVDVVRFKKTWVEAVDLVTELSNGGRFIVPHDDIRGLEVEVLRARKAGELVIFDESESGLRFPKFSVSGYTGILPDFVVLGGTLANGMALTMVGGKQGHMDRTCSDNDGEFSGEVLALAAAKSCMKILQTKHDLGWLWTRGEEFLKEFNSIHTLIQIQGYPTFGKFVGDKAAIALFWQEACLAGMLFGPKWYMNFPLADEIKQAIGSIKAILQKIKRGEVFLKGEMPKWAVI